MAFLMIHSLIKLCQGIKNNSNVGPLCTYYGFLRFCGFTEFLCTWKWVSLQPYVFLWFYLWLFSFVYLFALFYYYFLDAYWFFKRHKGNWSRYEERWRGTERSLGKGNCNLNALYEKIYFHYKKKDAAKKSNDSILKN